MGREGWNKDVAQLSSWSPGRRGGDTLFLPCCTFLRVTCLCVHHSTMAGGFRKHGRPRPQAFLRNPIKGSHGKYSVLESMHRPLCPGHISTLKAFQSPLVQRISISPMTAKWLDPGIRLHSSCPREAVKLVFWKGVSTRQQLVGLWNLLWPIYALPYEL